jgi:glucokinase
MHNRNRVLLVGDIGGTHTRLQLVSMQDGVRRVRARARFESARYASLTDILREYLATVEEGTRAGIERACLAVAGPVRAEESGTRAKVTNLPWEIDSRTVTDVLGGTRVHLVNDFEALGYGIEALSATDVRLLQAGEGEPRGVRAVLGAGTGLGQAIVAWQGDRYAVLPTEGGHVDFAPTDEEQVELWRYLVARHGRATYERVLSGPGLEDLYRFFREKDAAGPPGELAAPAITRAALTGSDVAAQRALDLFVRVYGAQAGNLALAALARGGVYLAGGIAPAIVDRLRAGAFIRAFLDKGRMRPLLQNIPVSVVMNEDAGLLGAERLALR